MLRGARIVPTRVKSSKIDPDDEHWMNQSNCSSFPRADYEIDRFLHSIDNQRHKYGRWKTLDVLFWLHYVRMYVCMYFYGELTLDDS